MKGIVVALALAALLVAPAMAFGTDFEDNEVGIQPSPISAERGYTVELSCDGETGPYVPLVVMPAGQAEVRVLLPWDIADLWVRVQMDGTTKWCYSGPHSTPPQPCEAVVVVD